MLTLSLKPKSKVLLYIGGECIEVVNRNKERVKLGFEAPQEVRIVRESVELRERECAA